MKSPEYYLTDCELEIFQHRTAHIVQLLHIQKKTIDIIELGAGDAIKSTYLLRYLTEQRLPFTYRPIDISRHILGILEEKLKKEIPGINIHSQSGEYFESLEKVTAQTSCRKAVLFLGSNIGNMELQHATQFCRRLHQALQPGDYLLIGFDLKKNPMTILNAYQDRAGWTTAFNKNMLTRINRELYGNFNLDLFQHFQNYDPLSGACRSFLISLADQIVRINGVAIPFSNNEPIHMEISQKFSAQDISEMAFRAGFRRVGTLYDRKKWFVDEVWQVN